MEINKNDEVKTYVCPNCGGTRVIRHRKVIECDDIENIDVYDYDEEFKTEDFDITTDEDTEYQDTDEPNSYSCGNCGDIIFEGKEDDFVPYMIKKLWIEKEGSVNG